MEIPEQLRCLFSARVEEQDESYLIEVPEHEIEFDNIQSGEMYRVAMIASMSDSQNEDKADSRSKQARKPTKPPVEKGDQRTVEIESLGDQGDGISRVERGFVVIVPDTEQGERVAVEITDVQENVAFAEVTERLSYYG